MKSLFKSKKEGERKEKRKTKTFSPAQGFG